MKNNNEICVYYTQVLTGLVSVKCHQNILSINDFNGNKINKRIIKIIDVLGRNAKDRQQPHFYIYNDGSVEKRIVIK